MVHCYASGFRLDCVLMRHDKVISYCFRQLKQHVEKNCPTHDLELVVVIHSLKIWGHYLDGVHVDVYIYCKSLLYIFIQKDLNL